MQFHLYTAEIFVPDGLLPEQALMRTTHMAIGAHQDDLEIMAAGAILECFQQDDKWFTGVVVTDGRGSPRDDLYKNYTDEQMYRVRFKEQMKAAVIGEYSAQVMLDYPSKSVKDGSDHQPVEDLALLLRSARPQVVYTHNLADKHDTHVGVALKVIAALRSLPEAERPKKVYGCEVWRSLDWLVDSDKVTIDLTQHENLQTALLGVFDSQISGGKRYDLATMGRRRANATFFESHGVDVSLGLAYAMDLTPLILDPGREILPFVQEHIARFAQDVLERLGRAG
ncbi:MAG TPA: PIG-L family deacetylase [Anaerolineales bacterium]|nr:PIG-L family deacetylase [Anaerolineales bacterium]